MQVHQHRFDPASGWSDTAPAWPTPPQLVLAFGERALLANSQHVNQIKTWYPQSHIVFASTAGEILNTRVSDNTLAVTAILFEKTTIHTAHTSVSESSDSHQAGQNLAHSLPPTIWSTSLFSPTASRSTAPAWSTV